MIGHTDEEMAAAKLLVEKALDIDVDAVDLEGLLTLVCSALQKSYRVDREEWDELYVKEYEVCVVHQIEQTITVRTRDSVDTLDRELREYDRYEGLLKISPKEIFEIDSVSEVNNKAGVSKILSLKITEIWHECAEEQSGVGY
jgi:hypothetical protein